MGVEFVCDCGFDFAAFPVEDFHGEGGGGGGGCAVGGEIAGDEGGVGRRRGDQIGGKDQEANHGECLCDETEAGSSTVDAARLVDGGAGASCVTWQQMVCPSVT